MSPRPQTARGLFIREGERERAGNELIEELAEIGTGEVTRHRDLKQERLEERPEEPMKNAGT